MGKSTINGHVQVHQRVIIPLIVPDHKNLGFAHPQADDFRTPPPVMEATEPVVASIDQPVPYSHGQEFLPCYARTRHVKSTSKSFKVSNAVRFFFLFVGRLLLFFGLYRRLKLILRVPGRVPSNEEPNKPITWNSPPDRRWLWVKICFPCRDGRFKMIPINETTLWWTNKKQWKDPPCY